MAVNQPGQTSFPLLEPTATAGPALPRPSTDHMAGPEEGYSAGRKVNPAFEGDGEWEEHRNTYCVYFIDRVGPGTGSNTGLFDLAEVTLSEAKQRAEDNAAGRWYALTLVQQTDQGRGLIWLDGYDANCSPRSLSRLSRPQAATGTTGCP